MSQFIIFICILGIALAILLTPGPDPTTKLYLLFVPLVGLFAFMVYIIIEGLKSPKGNEFNPSDGCGWFSRCLQCGGSGNPSVIRN
jgi:hypothetical protein